MRAGDMDRRITIDERTETYSPSGEPIIVWEPIATVWAEVQQQSGREFFASQQTVSERRVVFRLRWLDGITVLHRVRYDGREHDIQEVRELGRGVGLELHTTTTG
jgi:SPP1 family predicted phage head-tail adaptor